MTTRKITIRPYPTLKLSLFVKHNVKHNDKHDDDDNDDDDDDQDRMGTWFTGWGNVGCLTILVMIVMMAMSMMTR